MKNKTLKSLLAFSIAANPSLPLIGAENPTSKYLDSDVQYDDLTIEDSYNDGYEEMIDYTEKPQQQYLYDYEYESEHEYEYAEEIFSYVYLDEENPYESLVEKFFMLLTEHPIIGILNPIGEEFEIPLRAYPYSSASISTQLPSGNTVTLRSIAITDQQTWFYAETYIDDYTLISGYIHGGNFVTNHDLFLQWRADFNIDTFGQIHSSLARFAQLNATNLNAFPASYRPLIQALQSQRPNWTFVPFTTGRDWNTEINVQMSNYRSLIWHTSHPSWRLNDFRVEPNWVQASEGILRYFMDPRNFINDQDVFQFEVLSFNSNLHTLAATNAVLNNTFMHTSASTGHRLANGRSYAQAFLDLGREFNVSPLHLASRVRHEQGVQGTSGLISGTFPGFQGLFNYFNFGATAGVGATNEQIVTAGLTFARQQGWTTRDAALRGGAQLLGGEWLNRGQNTLYLQKFDVRPNRDWPRNFMQNIQAPSGEGRNIRNSYANMGILNSNFVFSIPVFNGMPTQASVRPDLVPLHLAGQTTGQVNFRTGAGTNHSVIRSLAGNTQLTVLHESNGWSQVQIGNQQGWVISTAIQLIERFGQTTGNVNFRSGPGTGHSIIRPLNGNTDLTVLGTLNDWSHVRIGNQQGWIITSAIRLTPRSGQTTGSVNFRSGAGTNHGVIRSLGNNTQLTVLSEQNGWSQVQIGNQIGWIISTAIRITERPGQTTGSVNFRTGPGTGHSIIRFLSANTQLTILDERDGWSQVRIGNQTGWIISTAIR